MSRVLAIFLDGYEQTLGQRLMAAGEMPELARLAASSARFLLEYGSAQRTGLAGEHFATGLAPDVARRWSGIHFDPQSYAAWQEGTRARPFAADLNCRTVVFDVPYFDLRTAPGVTGIVNWGAHDPGIKESSQPSSLLAELHAKFGAYPAERWTYCMPWPSVDASTAMGHGLAQGLDTRADAACWLLGDRFPDWDLALVAAGEPHSACEGLWHGIDPTHPLYALPGSDAAGASIRVVYHAIDRFIGRLAARFADARIVVFTLGGMGKNQSDVPSMLLLPELMYRHVFGSPWFTQPPQWRAYDGTSPVMLADNERWDHGVADGFPVSPARRVARRVLPRPVKAMLRKALDHTAAAPAEDTSGPARLPLDWMPASGYRRFWRTMPAFGLPSYYDGRVRVNLVGRESCGKVEVRDYRRVLEQVEGVVRACTDPATGKSVVASVEVPVLDDPLAASPSHADMVIVWNGGPLSFVHPSLGRIGPVPYRRTGGHTGPYGMAYVRADDCAAGDRGIRSSFDVVPTLLDLMGQPKARTISGTSLLQS